MKKIVAGAAFTRPANTTAYASGDLVANSATAGSVVPIQLSVAADKDRSFSIRRARLLKSDATLTNAAFRAHFYKTKPTASNGDNAAWLTTHAGYLGSIDITVDKAFASGSQGIGAAAVNAQIVGEPGSGTRIIYALLEARGAYTPVSEEAFTLTAEVEQD